MLPASYAMPTAVVLTVGGLITCFAGYRLFRIVLGIFGFIIGAMVTTQVIGAQPARSRSSPRRSSAASSARC